MALDWKWLFLYPDQGIATVNELAAPVDTPINFKITSSSVMNSFFVPALAGQIYAMPGMETKLHAVINQAGEYQGFSANYSGAGFSNMRFKFHGFSQADFDEWVKKVRSEGNRFGRFEYLKLEQPSEKDPVRYFSSLDPKLYDAILNMCVDQSKMCMNEMMHIDANGGGGMEGISNVIRLANKSEPWSKQPDRPAKPFVAALCTPTGTGPGGSLETATSRLAGTRID